MEKLKLNREQLKWIMILTMLSDHIALVLFPEVWILRIIGRITFPIVCFFISEGYFYTSDVKKYGIRLAIFALLSEIPYDLALSGTLFNFQSQNVFFTLLLGLFAIYLIERESSAGMKMFIVLTVGILAQSINADYGMGGVLLILCFYLFRNKQLPLFLSICVVNMFWIGRFKPFLIEILKNGEEIGEKWQYYFLERHPIQDYAVIAMIFILLYNNKIDHTRKEKKYFFYVFYPLHLVVLFLLKSIG